MRRSHRTRARSSKAQESSSYADAASAVNDGLRLFEAREYEAATRAFTSALGMNPNEDEARAASYNRACGYIKLNKYEEAKDDLIAAVNTYNLKFKVLMNDPDSVSYTHLTLPTICSV